MDSLIDPDKSAVESGMEISPEQMAAIHAAMMEELGVARKDRLPLEDKNGMRGNVDLEALDRGKKANDPRTLEFQIAQANASARNAWKNHVFDDVDQADLEIDNMNSGQSHRRRMEAGLDASGASRDSHQYRGGRGILLLRGRASRRGGRASDRGQGEIQKSNGLGSSKWGDNAHTNIHGILDRLRTADVPRGGVASYVRGSARGGSVKAAKNAPFPVPTTNLSFKDNRSIKELPTAQNIARRGAPTSRSRGNNAIKAPRPPRSATSNQNYVLASPEDFIARSWPNISKDDGNGTYIQTKAGENKLPAHQITLASAIKPSLEIEPRYSSSEETGFTNSVGPILPLKASFVELIPGLDRIVLHRTEVKVEKHDAQGITAMGLGVALIVSNAISSDQSSVIVEVRVQDRPLFQFPLTEAFQFKLESTSFQFDSEFAETSVRWVMRTPLPWMAKSFVDTIDRYRPQIILSPLVDCSDETDPEHPGRGEVVEDLISFGVEAPVQRPFSSFTQDLLGLMDDYAVDQTLDAINCDPSGPLLDQISVIMAAPEPLEQDASVLAAVNNIVPSKGAFLGGLATSKFAATNAVVGKFLRRSSVFMALPTNSATMYTEEVSRRVLEKVQTPVHDDESFAIAQEETNIISGHEPVTEVQQKAATGREHEAAMKIQNELRIQYTIEEMIGYRTKASAITEMSLSNPWVQQSRRNATRLLLTGTGAGVDPIHPSPLLPKVQPRNVMNITRLGVPIVAGVENLPRSQGLASSKYASKPSLKPEVIKPFVGLTENEAAQPSMSLDQKNMRRRDSFNSRASSETVKPKVQKFAGINAETLQHEIKYPASVNAALHRRSVRSTESGASCASFTTVSEGERPQGRGHHKDKNMDTLSKELIEVMREDRVVSAQLAESAPVLLDNKLSGPRVVKMRSGNEPSTTENLRQADSALNNKSAPQPSPTKTNDTTPAKAVALKRGLMSSKYAGDARDVTFAQAKPTVRPIPAIIETHHITATRTKNPAKLQEAYQASSFKSISQPLKPTASQFTPSKKASLHLQMGHVFHHQETTRPNDVDSMFATVLVQNPLIPGTYREVHGILKAGSMQSVANEGIQSSGERVPVSQADENIAPGSAFAGHFSSSVVDPNVKLTPSTRSHEKDNVVVQEVQLDVQKRLQKSLE